jgi:membrane-bound ClpP family serine protease
MKITRKMLLIITAGLGVFLIVYSLIRQFTGLRLSETFEKNLFDTVLFVALGLFLYNRKLSSDEKKEREAKERAEREAAEAEKEETGDEKIDDKEAGGSIELESAEKPVEADQSEAREKDPCPGKQE